MPQMSDLDWFFLSFYFIFLYNFLLMMINFLNYNINMLLMNFLLKIKFNNMFKFMLNWN